MPSRFPRKILRASRIPRQSQPSAPPLPLPPPRHTLTVHNALCRSQPVTKGRPDPHVRLDPPPPHSATPCQRPCGPAARVLLMSQAVAAGASGVNMYWKRGGGGDQWTVTIDWMSPPLTLSALGSLVLAQHFVFHSWLGYSTIERSTISTGV